MLWLANEKIQISLLQIVRKRLHGEVFSPSFSARNIFCKSRFREDDGYYDQEDNNGMDGYHKDSDYNYEQNDTKRNILMKVALEHFLM